MHKSYEGRYDFVGTASVKEQMFFSAKFVYFHHSICKLKLRQRDRVVTATHEKDRNTELFTVGEHVFVH
jgi:hypothetical protein